MSSQKILVAVPCEFLEDIAEALKKDGVHDFLGRVIGNVTILIIVGKTSKFKKLIFNLQRMKFERDIPILILNELGFFA